MRVSHIVFDVNDIDGTPAFWAAVLDLKETTRSPDWVDLEPVSEGGPMLSFQLVPEGKVVKNRLHLHVAAPDVPAARMTLAQLRASEASPLRDGRGGPWQIWRDPEGNELCLVTG
jgi:catechol 2,3-dioxygenase-like lactoylglutathione lyase family enzyme